jgi:hypothetical protein
MHLASCGPDLGYFSVCLRDLLTEDDIDPEA